MKIEWFVVLVMKRIRLYASTQMERVAITTPTIFTLHCQFFPENTG